MASIEKSVGRFLLIFCGLLIILLVFFNFRTRVPFSIGIQVFQIPFFFAFAIAYGAGAISWSYVLRRINRPHKKTENPPAAKTTHDDEQADIKSGH